MDFFVWQRTFVDDAGNVLASASVTVTDVVSGALAQLYSDPAGSVSIGNPITADSEGFVQFYVKAGFYNITATSGASSRTWTREAIGAPHPLTAAEISAGVTPVDYRYPEGHVYRYGTNTTPGTTDMTTAIQKAIDVMIQRGGGTVTFPYGETLAHSDTIGTNGKVTIDLNNSTLVALAGFPETIDSDKFGGTSGFTFPAPQIWVDNRALPNVARTVLKNGFVYGVASGANASQGAPIGLMVTSGANVNCESLRVHFHTYCNVVSDSVQNSTWIDVSGNYCTGYNIAVLNDTQQLTMISCDGSRAQLANFYMDEDSRLPGYRLFNANSPERNTFINCIWEVALATANGGDDEQDYAAYLVRGTENLFLGCAVVTRMPSASGAGIKCESGFFLNQFIKQKFYGHSADVPALINNGGENSFYEPMFEFWGDSTLVNLIEISHFTTIYRPTYANITISGKHVSASPADGRLLNYTPARTVGSYAQRPTEDVDTFYQVYATDLRDWITWDFFNDVWRRHDNNVNRAETATNLGDATHPVNTVGKYEGRMVYDTTNNVPLWAAGSAPTAVWQDLINGGAGDITPSS